MGQCSEQSVARSQGLVSDCVPDEVIVIEGKSFLRNVRADCFRVVTFEMEGNWGRVYKKAYRSE